MRRSLPRRTPLFREIQVLSLSALLALLPSGCTPESTPQAGEETAGAPVEEPLSPGGDTAPPMVPPADSGSAPDRGPLLPVSQVGAEEVGVEGEEAQAISDTLGILDRLDRLEAENDSLRGALGVLLSLQGDRSSVEDSIPEGESALLAVDTRQVQNWGFRIAVSAFFLILAGAVIRVLVWILDRLAERHAKRRLLFKRLVPVVRISLWFLSILVVAALILRIEAQGLIAAGAALGVAVGFAAQDILKNVFGGLIVLFDQPFQVGDKIQVGGTYGEVESIGLRSTRIVTPDDNLVSVPNSQIVDGQVANANAGELNCQVVTDLYLPGWIDESEAKRIAFDAAASSKYVYLNKPITVLVKDEFKETFLVHLKVKAYVLDPRFEFLLQSDVTERAREGFRRTGLLGPMHGVRAYVDLDRFPRDETFKDEEGE